MSKECSVMENAIKEAIALMEVFLESNIYTGATDDCFRMAIQALQEKLNRVKKMEQEG